MAFDLSGEIQTIINRYHVHRKQRNYYSTFAPVTLDNFERDMDWNWLWNNHNPSNELICKYHHKFNMDVIFESGVITKEEFEYYLNKYMHENIIQSRLEILDIR